MKIVILDDHHAILQFLKQKVNEVLPSADVVLCSTIHEAKMTIDDAQRPGCLICDLQINAGRSTAIPEYCSRLEIPFMVYSSHVDKVLLQELKKCGVCVYVSKLSRIEFLQRGIEALVVGENYFCPFVSATMDANEKFKETEKLILTEGQFRVMEVMLKGYNRVIAANMLHISLSTLNNHIARAREMNDCENFDELLRRFRYWDTWN
jgi:DNA-binding NarL/FixJ family response regulator